MASAFFAELVKKELQRTGKTKDETLKKGKAQFTVVTGDRRKFASEHTISELTFEVTEGAIKAPVAVSAMATISKYLDVEELGVVDNILASFGFGKEPKTKREASSVNIVYATDPEKVGAKYQSGRTDIGIQTTSGKYSSATNLRNLLQILTTKYVLEDMGRGNAPLKYRTGRFANSVVVKNPVLSPKATQVSLFYTYMLKPYSVFDPRFGNTRASHGRNPQRIIGEALDKAARDLIHARYNVVVKQANQSFGRA